MINYAGARLLRLSEQNPDRIPEKHTAGAKARFIRFTQIVVVKTPTYHIRPYRPPRCLLALMAERASRSASRLRSVSRLSQSCLPLATASSHLTRPLQK